MTKSMARIFWIIASVILLPGLVAASPTGMVYDKHSLIESKESLYNNIYIYKHDTYVSLTFGYNSKIYTESSYNTADEDELPVTYTRYMTAALLYPQKITSILEIGFGGGRTAWYLHRALPQAQITSVELDPAVIDLAHKYFGIKDEPNFLVESKDGRQFLARSKEKYDVIMIDAYRGPFVPFHLLTREFYQLVADHLAEGGVVMQNVSPDTMLFDSAVKTINSVFPQVEFYPADGNIVTVAYLGAQRDAAALAKTADDRQSQYNFRYALPDLLAKRQLLPPDTSFIDPHAKVLTDDFAPVEALHAIERHNQKWKTEE